MKRNDDDEEEMLMGGIDHYLSVLLHFRLQCLLVFQCLILYLFIYFINYL